MLGLENTKPSNESITLPAPIQIINDEELLADDIESENSEVPWLCHVPGSAIYGTVIPYKKIVRNSLNDAIQSMDGRYLEYLEVVGKKVVCHLGSDKDNWSCTGPALNSMGMSLFPKQMTKGISEDVAIMKFNPTYIEGLIRFGGAIVCGKN